MTDVTPIFLEALRRQHSNAKLGPKQPGRITDDFLKEAYRINSHINSLRSYLRSIRQPYLSASQPSKRAQAARHTLLGNDGHFVDGGARHLSDAQRDQIDAESKQLLRDVNFAIQNLADAEQLRQRTEASLAQRRYGRGGLRKLGAWAAGQSNSAKTADEELDDARTGAVNVHRGSILWYLRRQLEAASTLQMGMMEARLVREMEKNKSMLYKTQGLAAAASDASLLGTAGTRTISGGTQAGSMPTQPSTQSQLDDVEPSQVEQRLTSEQLQLLAEENQDILKHYQDTLDQVRTAERSLIEISELQTTLANNLAVQSAHVDQLGTDALDTTQNIGGGNKQLKKAAERKSTAKVVFYSSCVFSLCLIMYDFIF